MGGLGVGAVVGDEDVSCVSVGLMPAVDKVTGVWLMGDLDVDEACDVSTSCHRVE